MVKTLKKQNFISTNVQKLFLNLLNQNDNRQNIGNKINDDKLIEKIPIEKCLPEN